MPAPKKTATSLFMALAGTLGFSVLAGVLVTVMVAPAIAVTGVTANNTVGIFNSLPEYIKLDPGSQQNTIVALNKDGSERHIATIYKQNREEKTLDEISDYLECAAIAGEDRRFYDHGGVDMPSLVRAAVGQITGESDSGASTLSMQTVRNILQQQALNDDSLTEEEQRQEILDSIEQTLDRKVKEMKLAIGLEKAYTKDEILQGYLNIANFGGNTYGVQAAAFQYFGKQAADVTIAEAASLIAIVQYPNLRDLTDPEHFVANQERRDVILTAMYRYGMTGDDGCITREELDEALAIPVDEEFINPQASRVGCNNAAKGFGFICDYAKRVVHELGALGSTPEERLAAWDRGGYKLVLTVKPELQSVAWNTVHEWAPANENRFELGAAATSVEVGTGNIITMAQNKNFDESLEPANKRTSTSVNFAADVEHGGSKGFQPGSTYKPYVLLAFLAAGHGINEYYNASVREVNQAEFADSCTEFLDANGDPLLDANGHPIGPPWGGKYKFNNDSGEGGPYNIVRGTAASVNSIYIQMAKAVDQCEIRKLAESIGVRDASGNDLITRPSCSIGGCEVNLSPLTQAAAYAAIANGGVYCKPIMIAKVYDPSGEELKGQDRDCGQSLVSPAVANTAAYAMAAVMTGTGSAANPNDGTPYIGKTGTTDESVHTWMVGSSRKVATAVWVGNIKGTQAMRNVRVNGTSGGLLRHRIFRPIAQAIDARYPGGGFPGADPSLLNGNPIEVPNLIGSTLEAAQQALTLAEFNVTVVKEKIDSDLPAGQVARTSPGAGAKVPRGTTVKVYVSNGLGQSVPNVVGMDPGAAQTSLEGAGYTVEPVCIDPTNPAYPAMPPPHNEVVSQDPAAGAMRNPAATTVKITYYQPVCP